MKKVLSHLYVQVLIGIAIGIAIGHYRADFGVALLPIGEGFIALIKMLIAPVIFCTVVLGIANAGDLKKAGRIGAKALLYFEIVSTLALVIGLLTANILKPGSDFNAKRENLDPSKVSMYVEKAKDQSTVKMIQHIIPKTFTDAFTGSGDLLQVILVALLFGVALSHAGAKGVVVHNFLTSALEIFFRMVNMVMKLAPLGACAAMAFTVGEYGLSSLSSLAKLIGVFYFTCILFITVVLGLIARLAGFNIFRFIFYIKNELLMILGTSSSESALVPIMEKLEKLGCSKAVVGLVIPTGYSFNLDGTNIYLTLATLFMAQALGIELSLGQQLSLLLVAMISSKGASGVTGAGFIALAATLAVVPDIPIAALTLIMGIDRFMSEARALTNAVGNGVAAIVVSRWEGELDRNQLSRELSHRVELPV